MSIERQLVEEFKRDSRNRMCPPGLDARIAAEYRRLAVNPRGERIMWRKRKAAKIILIAVIVLAACGFGYAGNKLLFEDHKGRLTVNYQTDQQLQLEPADVGKIRSAFETVKAQLDPGDTAVVYLKDYELKFNGSPIALGINKPATLPIDAWRATLKQHHVEEALPESLLGTFKLTEGMEASPYQFNLGTDTYRLLNEMKAESEKTGSKVLWRKTDASNDQLMVPYTSVYRNSSQDTIYVTWLVADSGTDLKLLQAAPPNTAYEDLKLDGVDAHYLLNDQSLYGQSPIEQDVTWLKESGDHTIVYHVQSDSPNLTKEQLIQAAQSLLP